MNSKSILFSTILFFLLASSCQPKVESPNAEENKENEIAIIEASAMWMVAMSEKDLDKTMSFMTSDIKAWWGGVEEADKETVRRDVAAAFSDPNYELKWQIIKVKVAKSGDLAYEMSTYQETMSDDKGKPKTYTGKFVTIWEKQSDGSWKATVDIGNLNK